MEKKGCQAVLILLGVTMAAGMILSGTMGGNHSQTPKDQIIFEVGSQKISMEQFNERVKTVTQSQSANMAPGTPQAELAAHMTAVQGFVNDAAIASLAKEKGVAITGENIRTVGQTVATQYMEQTRAQLIMQGMIKPDATKAEADKKISELTGGKTPDKLIEEQTDEIVKKYNDPKTKSEVASALLPALVQESFKKSVQFSEDDLKAAYNDYNFSVIRFDDLSKPLEERQSAAIDAIEQIKGGKDFSAVQAEVNPKAKPEDKTVTLTGGALDSSPELKVLKDLKPGQLSDMILAGGSPTIYRFNSVKPNLPKDFETSKALLLENGKASKARQLFDEELKKKTDALEPKFKDKALEIGFAVFSAYGNQEYQKDPTKLTAFLKEKQRELRDPLFTSDNFPGIAAATQFLVEETLYAQATDEEKTAMLDDRIEAANRMLEFYEDNGFRVTFAKELLEKGRNDDALLFATAAAQSNGDFEQNGQAIYAQISMIISDAEAKKAWSQESLDAIKKEQDRWQTEHANYVKDQKEIEEAQKKAQEDLDKELENQKKEESAGTAPKTGEGTTPPVGGASIPKTGN
jgi:hypothetical protein